MWAPPVPPSEDWRGFSEDPAGSPVPVSGRLTLAGERERLIVAVHGLGGCADSRYLWEFTTAATAAGWSVLRLNLRGADREGEDFYHGGQTEDLHGASASPVLAGFEHLAVVGFSLGGHAVLRYATEAGDERLRAIATVCPPVDLAAGQRTIDGPSARIYRRYVLGHIKEIYREVALRREVPIPASEADAIERLWDWDEKVVAPRYGFAGAEDYYARCSVGPHLGEVRVPALVVASEDDPMVPAASLHQRLDPEPAGFEVHWVPRSGHLSFSRGVDLGHGPGVGLNGQLLGWLDTVVR